MRLALFVSCWLTAVLAPGEAARPLAGGVSVERGIAAGETHVYEMPVRKGEAFDVTVRRDGISVSLSVECPGRPAALERGQIIVRKFTIGAVAVAGESGTARIRVVAPAQGVPPGKYRISRSTTRPARDEDRVAVEAEALLEGYVSTTARTAAERARWIATLEKAIGLARSARDDRILAEDLTFLGYEKFYSSLPKEALACHTEALSARRRLHDPAGEIESSNAIAMTHSNMSEYREAIRHYERAVALAASAGDQAAEARVLSNMAIAYNALGEHDEARVRLEKALGLRRPIHDAPGEW